MEQHRDLKILLFPYLATGHVTAFLELAKKLSDRGFSIDLCSTPINLSFIKKRVPQNYTSSIQLVDYLLPNLPQLPPECHTTNGLPNHLKSLIYTAYKNSKPQFHQILEEQKPNLVIYDAKAIWPGGVASTLNIPAIKFYTVNAAAFCFFDYLFFKPGLEFPFKDLYLTDLEKERMKCFNLVAEVEDQVVDREKFKECDSILLVDSSRAIDGKYVDFVSETSQVKIVPLGARFEQGGDGDMEEMEIINWLGKKKEHSTVFVSFGTEQLLTKEEMEEVAYGLELSDVDFIWVVRFEDEEVKLEEALPEGFLERIGERGRVVEGWVPQVRILKHPSIGAFVSHCGWNSTLESVEFGVPIIGMPMHNIDQSVNARLMVGNGVAVEVANDENGKLRRGNITENIKKVIREETGKNLRRKMNDLNENMRLQRDEEIDGVVKVITQLCAKS